MLLLEVGQVARLDDVVRCAASSDVDVIVDCIGSSGAVYRNFKNDISSVIAARVTAGGSSHICQMRCDTMITFKDKHIHNGKQVARFTVSYQHEIREWEERAKVLMLDNNL